MSLRKIFSVVTGNGRDKVLPPVEYSGEPTEAALKAIREAHAEDTKDRNLKTVSGPAW